MSISRDGIDINIRTKFDATGAQQAETSIQRQIAATTGLSTSYRDAAASAQFLAAAEQGRHAQAAQTNAVLTAEQSKVSKSAAESAAAMMEAKKADDEATFSKSQLINALKQLKHEVPGLSAALTILKNPIAAVTLAIAGLIYNVMQSVRALQEQAQAMREVADAADSANNPVRTNATAAAGAALAYEAWRDALGDVADKAGDVAGKLADITKEMERQSRIAAEREDADMAVALAQIDQQEAAGNLTGAQASGARSETRLRFAGIRAAREEEMARQKADQLFNAANTEDLKRYRARKELPGAISDLSTAEQRDAQIRQNAANHERVRAQQEADARKDIDAGSKRLAEGPAFSIFGLEFGESTEEARKKIAGGQSALSQIALARDRDAARSRQSAADLERARTRVSRLTTGATSGAAEDLFKQGNSAQRDYEAQREANAARLGGQQKAGEVNDETATIKHLLQRVNEEIVKPREKEGAAIYKAADIIGTNGEEYAAAFLMLLEKLQGESRRIDELRAVIIKGQQLG